MQWKGLAANIFLIPFDFVNDNVKKSIFCKKESTFSILFTLFILEELIATKHRTDQQPSQTSC